MKVFLSILAILLTHLWLPFETHGASSRSGDFDLTILHINDIHSSVDQYPVLKTAVDQIRKSSPNTLFLLAGDVFTGSPYFSHYKGMADMYFLNRLGLDAFTVGNHEFDEAPEGLERFIKKADFPFLSANIRFPDSFSPYMRKEISSEIETGKIYPAIIKVVGKEKIGIIGLTTETTNVTKNKWAAKIEDPILLAQKLVRELEKMGVNKIIVLSHLGFEGDQKLAFKVDGIDIIVGGHSHTKLVTPYVVKKTDPVLIVQAHERLKYLGVLNVRFNQDGQIILFEGTLQKLVDSIYPRDKKFQKKVDAFLSKLDPTWMDTINSSEVFLDGERNHVRKEETNFGNLIADSFLQEGKKVDSEVTIGMVNAGSIRSSIEKGKITRWDLAVAAPFNLTLTVMKLTGEEILQTLEEGLANFPKESHKFLHVSGLRVEFDPNKPEMERIVSVKVMSPKGNYEPLNKNAWYKVATNSYVAFGKGYPALRKAQAENRMQDKGILDVQVIANYLQKMKVVAPEVEGRIVIRK